MNDFLIFGLCGTCQLFLQYSFQCWCTHGWHIPPEKWKPCTLDLEIAKIMTCIHFVCPCICCLHFCHSLQKCSSVRKFSLNPNARILFDIMICLPRNCLLVEVLYEILWETDQLLWMCLQCAQLDISLALSRLLLGKVQFAQGEVDLHAVLVP